MANVRSRNTGPELSLRRALWRVGLRYRLDPALPGRPDLVFRGAKVAVFVDGDFWHGNQWSLRGFDSIEEYFRSFPNQAYWSRKISGNVRRDNEVTVILSNLGWTVIRIWESQIVADVEACVARVARALSRDDYNL